METTKLYINGHDAEATWGLRLDGGDQSGLDALVAFKPLKEPVVNKNVTAQGAVVVCGTGLLDERTVSLPVHIVAYSYTDFLTKRNALYAELTHAATQTQKAGELEIVVKRVWSKRGVTKTAELTEYEGTMYYTSCTQYTQFAMPQNKRYNSDQKDWTDDANRPGYGIAKFILSLYEPNEPTI